MTNPRMPTARLIVTERRDLPPSVAKITSGALDEHVQLRAIDRFRDSVRTIGDPHRDPRAAIAVARDAPASR
jgi:hypothetical protein